MSHMTRVRRPRESLFVAVRGELFDAHKFLPQVMEQGAVGVISELARPDDFHGAWIQVEDIRRAMAARRGRSSSSSFARTEPCRHHRHQRKDDLRIS